MYDDYICATVYTRKGEVLLLRVDKMDKALWEIPTFTISKEVELIESLKEGLSQIGLPYESVVMHRYISNFPSSDRRVPTQLTIFLVIVEDSMHLDLEKSTRYCDYSWTMEGYDYRTKLDTYKALHTSLPEKYIKR